MRAYAILASPLLMHFRGDGMQDTVLPGKHAIKRRVGSETRMLRMYTHTHALA